MCLGIPARVVDITDSDLLLGTVEIAGVRRDVNLACVVDEQHPLQSLPGCWVLVHVGFALSRIDAEEARRGLELLSRIGLADDEIGMLQAAGAPGA